MLYCNYYRAQTKKKINCTAIKNKKNSTLQFDLRLRLLYAVRVKNISLMFCTIKLLIPSDGRKVKAFIATLMQGSILKLLLLSKFLQRIHILYWNNLDFEFVLAPSYSESRPCEKLRMQTTLGLVNIAV